MQFLKILLDLRNFFFAKKKSRTFCARGRLLGERPTASNNTEEEEKEEEEEEEDAVVVVVIQFLSAAVVVAKVCLLRVKGERENTNTSDTKSAI